MEEARGKMFKLVRVELRRQMILARSYIVSYTADHFFFVVGFLILAGLFNMATDGAYREEAPLLSLIGYLTWRVAAAIIREFVQALTDEARWGTLEQIWLSGCDLTRIILARAVVLVLFYTLRILLIALFIVPILQIPLGFPFHAIPGATLLYLLTLIAPLGLALTLIGLQLVYKNVEALAFPLATILLFLTGALSPLHDIPVLYMLSRFLPIAIGVDLMRELLVHGAPIQAVVLQPAFAALLLNSAIYLAAGCFVMNWARARVLAQGSLAHY
jgi:ABC-2 type transport system permease protein